jgi:hypothetical protein
MGQYDSYSYKYVRVNATADGDNTVIAAPSAGERIVVLSYALNVNAAGVVTLQDSAASPGVYASFEFPDSGGAVYGGPVPAFELPKSLGFEINNAAGVDTTGHITYALVS